MIPLYLYIGVLTLLGIYGTHRFWQLGLYLSHRRRLAEQQPRAHWRSLPSVTVQIPMFNESPVAERVIEAAARLDYPRDRLQIQILDDSTDRCAAIARQCAQRLRDQGLDVDYRHRAARSGYKAGALDAGLHHATGEFVAIFDADFIPPRDFLRHTVHFFTDERVGLVQTSWDHLNRNESWLTRAQALALDGHFEIEQVARAGGDRWFNFNGTAGIWRRACIDEAGGWEQDTLTEDADLAYRAQLRGWRFLYLPDLRCPAELPPDVPALLGQQYRWNKGLIQNGLKLLPRILTAREPAARRLEVWFHLTSPLLYIALFVLTLLVPLTVLFDVDRSHHALPTIRALGLASLVLGTGAAAGFFLCATIGRNRLHPSTLLEIPLLMALGIGLSANNSRAALSALAGRRSAFVRTPKFNGARISTTDPAATPHRRTLSLPRGLVELGLGLICAASAIWSFWTPITVVSAPFLALFATGYLIVGVGGLRDDRRARLARRQAAPVVPALPPTSA